MYILNGEPMLWHKRGSNIIPALHLDNLSCKEKELIMLKHEKKQF